MDHPAFAARSIISARDDRVNGYWLTCVYSTGPLATGTLRKDPWGRDLPIALVVSIDTEEDNWEPVRDGLTAENVRELPKLAGFLERLGIRPTYFVNYQVARQPWAAGILRDIAADGRAEIAAHVHPWNTPPYDDAPSSYGTMLRNYPLEAQVAKIRIVTELLAEATGMKPTSFRAGRFGIGPETITALIRTGYRTDSSVTPYYSWEAFDHGPDFLGAGASIYGLDGRGDVRLSVPKGLITEVPVSAGFTRFPVERWAGIERFFRRRSVAALHLAGLATRGHLVKKSIVSPESAPVRDMLAVSRRLIEAQVSHINMTFHSSSLRPGLTPFTTSRADVDGLYDAIAAFLEGLSKLAPVIFKTVAEAALGTEPVSPPRQ